MNVSGSPVVRKATAADLPGLVAVDSFAVAHAERPRAIARAIDQGECLVCVAGGRPAGYIVLDHSFFGRGFIPLVVVAPSMRRQGIAQLLFAAAESQCKTDMLFTSTNASNVEAQRLLERIGFKPSGRIENLDPGDSELVYFKFRVSPHERSAMNPSEQDRLLLERLEEALWREETRFDTERMNALVAPDFFEVGRSGRQYTREETLSIPRQRIDAAFPLDDFRVRLLDENVAHVTYNSAVSCAGTVEHARRSSIWSRTSSGWVLRFHQGTPYQE